VPKRIISSAIGFLVSLSILGLALFPWLAGILAQSIGIWSLLPYVLLLTVLMLVFWWVIFRILPTSKQRITSEIPIEV
jgi:fucose permease